MLQDHHQYYTSQLFKNGGKWWTELKTKNESIQHASLSSNHLLAVVSDQVLIYGNKLENYPIYQP